MEDNKKPLTALERAAEVINSMPETDQKVNVGTVTEEKKPVPLKEVKFENCSYRVAKPCNFNFEKVKKMPSIEVYGANTTECFFGTNKSGVPKIFAPWGHEMVRQEVAISVAFKVAQVKKAPPLTEAEQLAKFGLA